MSAGIKIGRGLFGGCAFGLLGAGLLAPGTAAADGLLIPGLGPDPSLGRPSYRESYNDYPPPQHNALGLPKRTPQPSDRPSYRQTYNDYPPPGGRYGGGFIEYVMTGGRPEPVVAPPTYAAPIYATPAYAQPYTASDYNAVAAPAAAPVYATNPARAALPKGGLPDYSAVVGGAPAAPAPQATYTPSAYTQPASVESGLAQIFGQPSFGSPGPGTSGQAVYNEPGSPYDPSTDAGAATRPMNPIYERQMVAYSGHERPGTIVIDTPQKFLYLVQGNGQALRYGIGVGRPGFTWAGVKSITRKAEWPGWTPPAEMMKRRPDLPRHMDGGVGNPLGARAMYLGSSMYRIHGTTEPYTIGTNVSSGCIRMMNQDVIDLYGRVGVGTRVVVM